MTIALSRNDSYCTSFVNSCVNDVLRIVHFFFIEENRNYNVTLLLATNQHYSACCLNFPTAQIEKKIPDIPWTTNILLEVLQWYLICVSASLFTSSKLRDGRLDLIQRICSINIWFRSRLIIYNLEKSNLTKIWFNST